MTWHGICFKIPSCSPEQAHLHMLTCSPNVLLIKTIKNSWPTKKQSNTKIKIPLFLPSVTINNRTFVVFYFRQMMWHIIQLSYHCKNFITSTSHMWIINIPPRIQGILLLLFMSGWDQVMAYIGIIWYVP